MQKHDWIGKRVRVKSVVKVCYSDKLADIVGELQYLGTNKLMGWDLQCTIERMPIQLQSLSQLELIDN